MSTSWTWEWASREESAVGAVESTLLDVRWPEGGEPLGTSFTDTELREAQKDLPRRLSFSVGQRRTLIDALERIRAHEARGHRVLNAPVPKDLEAAYQEIWNAALDKELGVKEMLSLIQVSRMRLLLPDPERDQRIRLLRGLGPHQVAFSQEQRDALMRWARHLRGGGGEVRQTEAARKLNWIAVARGMTVGQLTALIHEGFELPLRGLEG